MKYGYARTSTDDQTTALQLAALKRARCSHIYEDRAYQEPPASAQAPCPCALPSDLITMLDDLRARGVKFHSLTEAIDTATPTGRAMWQMIEC
jgi:DNA invertase Pin-like site-specific DNA recombinase